MSFGEWLRAERERRGWSQQHLAEQAGVTQQAIYLLERGKRPNPGGKMLAGLAGAFGVTIDELLKHTALSVELDQLRTEGVPADVLAELEDAAPELSPAQWQIIVAVARDMAGRAERRPQRAQRPAHTAEPSEPPQERPGPDPPGRISAAGRFRRLEV